MKIFGAEQERVLGSLYGAEAAEVYSALLRSLSAVLEEKVSPLSLALDQGKGEITKPRRVLFDQGVCKLPHAAEFGGMGVPFGVYALAMELAAAADASTAMSLGIHNTVADAVARFGSRRAEEAPPSRPPLGEEARRLRPHRAHFRLRRPLDAHEGCARGQALRDRRLQDVHHQRGRGRPVPDLRFDGQRARRLPRRGHEPGPEGREAL